MLYLTVLYILVTEILEEEAYMIYLLNKKFFSVLYSYYHKFVILLEYVLKYNLSYVKLSREVNSNTVLYKIFKMQLLYCSLML